MKKLLQFLLIYASNLGASLIGNPADPSILDEGFWISDRCWSNLRMGMSGDFLIEKRMRSCRFSKGLGISNPEMNWQLAAGFSQNLGPLKPYIGGVTSHLVYVLNRTEGRHLRFHDLLAAGVFEGCTLSVGSRILLNIEARQFFESGVSLSGEIRF
jgi:hypothetical protein